MVHSLHSRHTKTNYICAGIFSCVIAGCDLCALTIKGNVGHAIRGSSDPDSDSVVVVV